MVNYKTYKADVDDFIYTTNFYNLEHSTITLLISKEEISESFAHQEKTLTTSVVINRLQKQEEKNRNGNINLDKGVFKLTNDIFVPEDNQNAEVQVLNTQQQASLYHFKVMELKVHEDTTVESECRLRFHFIFDMIKSKKRKKLEDFVWDISSNVCQRLYLSQDTTRLMEVVNNYVATVYYRVNFEPEGTNSQFDQMSMSTNA